MNEAQVSERSAQSIISSTWGKLTLCSCVATSVIYVFVGLFACRRLIRTNWRWVLILGLYFLVGVLHGFFYTAIPSFAVACIFGTFSDSAIDIYETVVYTAILVVLTMFFAVGKKTILYAF